MTSRYLQLFTVWILATASPGDRVIVVEEPGAAGFSAERLGRLDKSMRGYVDRKEIAGAVALMARRGKVVYHKSSGSRDAETKAPTSSDVIFRIASTSRLIVSVRSVRAVCRARRVLSVGEELSGRCFLPIPSRRWSVF